MLSLSKKISAYIRLMRLDKPVGTLLLMWNSLWGLWLAGNGKPPAKIALILLLGTWSMRSAGCVINDLADRHIDGFVKRTRYRPLAAGELSVFEAVLISILLFLFSFYLVLQLNRPSLLVAVGSALTVFLYPFCKRFLPAPQAVLGIAFASAILLAHTAILGKITLAGGLMFLGGAFWALVYDTYYALVDRDDDLPLKLHSTAILARGCERRFIALMAALMLLCLILSGIAGGRGSWYYLGLLSAALLMAQELYMIRGFNRARCFAAFHHNNWVGATIWAGLVLDFLP